MRHICVVTGSRAEYGILSWFLKDLAANPRLGLQLVATGTHLSPEFGMTADQIEQDGLVIARRVEMLLSSDNGVGVAKSMGVGMLGFADAFRELSPDLVVVLGDRFEIFAAVAAAAVARIPIAHIHGGESTEGAIDDVFRHAITKMSHLHFTSTERYRQRVIQMGEHPDRVWNVGAPSLDALQRMRFLEREELEAALGIRLGNRNVLATYHPVTLEDAPVEEQLTALFGALDGLKDTCIIFTAANADMQGRRINSILHRYAAESGGRAHVFGSLGQSRYLSLLRTVDAVVGNSSSGIIEAPSLGTPTVNIGNRQAGRVRAASVIDCAPDRADIGRALGRAIAGLPEECFKNPYGNGGASRAILEILDRHDSFDRLLGKPFYEPERGAQT